MEKVLSPCIGVCRISQENGICEGCFRTREEISRWRVLDYQAKKRIISELQERSKELGKR